MTATVIQAGLAMGAGLLLFLAAPGPLGHAAWAWIALIPLLLAASQVRPARAALLGLLCGLVHYTLLLYWVLIVLGTYGYLSWYVSVPALLLLALYMALYTAIFTAAMSFTLPALPPVVSAPFLWVGLDYVRGHLFTGFPWSDLGYSQYRVPMLIQTADLFGHHGVTFLIVLVNATLVWLWLGPGPQSIVDCQTARPRTVPIWPGRRVTRHLMPVALLLLAAAVYSIWVYQATDRKVSAAPTAAVGVVQGNIPQDEKWLPTFQARTVDTYIGLSQSLLAQHRVKLLIWPETALPFYPMENHLFQELLARLVLKHGVMLLAGAPHRQDVAGATRYYNSSFLIAPDGGIAARHDKQHLVPYGEYIPLRSLMPTTLAPIVETMGDFTPGASSRPIRAGDLNLGVLICYESIFPDLARRQVTQGADLLVNLTNDAWYGRSSAPWQQLAMAVFRAIETRRSLARAANTGISVFIDPLGRTRELSPLFEPFQAATSLPILSGTTFFCRIGYLFPMACIIWSMTLVAWLKRGRRAWPFCPSQKAAG